MSKKIISPKIYLALSGCCLTVICITLFIFGKDRDQTSIVLAQYKCLNSLNICLMDRIKAETLLKKINDLGIKPETIIPLSSEYLTPNEITEVIKNNSIADNICQWLTKQGYLHGNGKICDKTKTLSAEDISRISEDHSKLKGFFLEKLRNPISPFRFFHEIPSGRFLPVSSSTKVSEYRAGKKRILVIPSINILKKSEIKNLILTLKRKDTIIVTSLANTTELLWKTKVQPFTDKKKIAVISIGDDGSIQLRSPEISISSRTYPLAASVNEFSESIMLHKIKISKKNISIASHEISLLSETQEQYNLYMREILSLHMNKLPKLPVAMKKYQLECETRLNQIINIKKLIKKLDLNNASTVVDIGAGSGLLTLPLLSEMPEKSHLFATEVDPEMISDLYNLKAKNGLKNFSPVLVSDNGVDEFYLTNKFDAAILMDVYNYLENPVSYFRELKQSFNKNARVYIIMAKFAPPFLEFVDIGDFKKIVFTLLKEKPEHPIYQRASAEFKEIIDKSQTSTHTDLPENDYGIIISELNSMLTDRLLFYDLCRYYHKNTPSETEWGKGLKQKIPMRFLSTLDILAHILEEKGLDNYGIINLNDLHAAASDTCQPQAIFDELVQNGYTSPDGVISIKSLQIKNPEELELNRTRRMKEKIFHILTRVIASTPPASKEDQELLAKLNKIIILASFDICPRSDMFGFEFIVISPGKLIKNMKNAGYYLQSFDDSLPWHNIFCFSPQNHE